MIIFDIIFLLHSEKTNERRPYMKSLRTRSTGGAVILLALCFLLIASLAVTDALFAVHDCAGDHCIICLLSSSAEINTICFILVISALTVILRLASVPINSRKETPVTLKSKLSN